MTKPDDIPQDVWDKAILYSGVYTEPAGDTLSELRYDFARAIMAAKAEEREDIWAIASGNAVGRRELERLAMEAGDAEGCLLHALLARENDQIAAAIRKRGEAD